MASRQAELRYQDPLELIWVGLAERLGFRIVRSDEVFASYDGAGCITLCKDAHFDADDSVAQLIFHELCHALVAGHDQPFSVDWGLGQGSQRDAIQEYACHRVQARLAADHGLRRFFAVTTDHRPYWDSLPLDPLRSRSEADDAAVDLARLAYHRALTGPWSEHLTIALQATRAIARAVAPYAPPDSLWVGAGALHASGLPEHTDPTLRCGACALAHGEGDSRSCLRRSGLTVSISDAACEGFEARFDATACESCGACCGEGFHRVELEPEEPFMRRHLGLVSHDPHGAYLARPSGRCVALRVEGAQAARRYRCAHYTDRPRACAEFEVAGSACFEARRRVGLSA